MRTPVLNRSTARPPALLALLFLAATVLPAPAGAQKIYKHVDQDGNVTYSDEAMTDDAVEMNLPPISVVQTDRARPPGGGAREAEGEEAPVGYETFRLLSPEPDETFFAAEGAVPVSLSADRPLAAGHRYRVFMDGEVIAETGNTALALQNVNPGAHVVYAEIFDPEGRVLARTDSVTFYFRRPSIFQPGRRGGP